MDGIAINLTHPQAHYRPDVVSTESMNLSSSTVSPDLIIARQLEQECFLRAKFVINTVCAGSLCILGILGNSLSCLVLRKDKDTPVASFLLQALALTDTFFLCTWLAHFSLDDLFNYLHMSHEFRYHWWLVRLFTYPLLFIGQTATIWMTVLIAVSRFVAVCKPYKAVQYCTLISIQRAVFCVITASVVYNLPRFFENKLVTDSKNGTVKSPYTRTEFADTRAYNMVYFDIMYYIFIFVMPLMLLATLNMKLTIAYRSIQQRRNSMRGIGRREFMDNNITLVMIIVVLVFMLCNAPARLVQIIWNYRRHRCLSANFFLQEISIVLEVFNSSANFIIYCAFRKQFRLILQSSFCIGRNAQATAAALSISRVVTTSLRSAEEQEFLQTQL